MVGAAQVTGDSGQVESRSRTVNIGPRCKFRSAPKRSGLCVPIHRALGALGLRWTRGRCHQESSQATHCGIGERVQGFHRGSTQQVTKLKAELESETGLMEGRGTTGNAREPVARGGPSCGTRFVVPRIAWSRRGGFQMSVQFHQDQITSRAPGVVECQKLRVARRTDCTFVASSVARSFLVSSRGSWGTRSECD